MKKRSFALVMAFMLALALPGCSAGRENSSDPGSPSSGVQNGTDAGGASSSAGIDGSADGNDAMQGGGAGGTNDLDNNGLPDGSASVGGQSRSRSNTGSRVMDDIGDAAGDLARGAGNAVRDAGNAIGDATSNVGRAMR